MRIGAVNWNELNLILAATCSPAVEVVSRTCGKLRFKIW